LERRAVFKREEAKIAEVRKLEVEGMRAAPVSNPDD
jgi:hypothetical protein